jgi:predicted transcriptional regulator
MEPHFTDRQLDLMNILWDEGSATVREARKTLDEELAYTSVLTVFQTLEKNGHVRHEPEGKAYRYHPTVSRSQAGKAAATYVLRRVFDGSAEKFLRALADQETVASEGNRELPETLESREAASPAASVSEGSGN